MSMANNSNIILTNIDRIPLLVQTLLGPSSIPEFRSLVPGPCLVDQIFQSPDSGRSSTYLYKTGLYSSITQLENVPFSIVNSNSHPK